jgi:hypothetical protein
MEGRGNSEGTGKKVTDKAKSSGAWKVGSYTLLPLQMKATLTAKVYVTKSGAGTAKS